MAKINVFSKLRNDVEFRLYKNEKSKRVDGIDLTISHVIGKVVIKGITNYLIENDKHISLIGQLARTEVDSDLWDKIFEENKIGNVLLRKGQVFAAKNEIEAQAMVKNVPIFISDLRTKEELRKPKKTNKKLI